MHGVPGWTIQYPNGEHSHAYPDGGVRNHFQRTQSTDGAAISVFVGAVVVAALVLDDFTGIGVADDYLIPAGASCVVGGLHDLYGEQVCTECGEVYYGF